MPQGPQPLALSLFSESLSLSSLIPFPSLPIHADLPLTSRSLSSLSLLSLSNLLHRPRTSKPPSAVRFGITVLSLFSFQVLHVSRLMGTDYIMRHHISSPSNLNRPATFFPIASGGIVALGKFDALHIGHRELAIQASKLGAPYLLSFVGMAEVFGWEPRAPIVAKCDRSRVLSSWSPYCGNVAPTEVRIEFSSVRHLTPKQFVEKLSKELGVGGVVAGENYRFGYKAAGDALDLVRLCEDYGIGAYIINSVMDKNQDHRSLDSSDKKDKGQVSSTRVRHALDVGDMRYVSELLGRQHRLILIVKDVKELPNTSGRCRISVPKSCLLNQPPKDGLYGNCFLLFGSENQVPCRVFIDTSQIHLEVDGLELSNYNDSHEARLLGIEFSECGSDSA